MAKYIFVVSRQCPALYDDFAHDFKNDPTVEVVLDRRIGQRRIATIPVPTTPRDRRRGDRRMNPEPGGDVATLGYVLVRVES